jgi:hypothetical protein
MWQRALTAQSGQQTGMSNKQEMYVLLQASNKDEALLPIRELHPVIIAEHIACCWTEPRLADIVA